MIQKQESQFEAIRRAVEERSPEHVAVNISGRLRPG